MKSNIAVIVTAGLLAGASVPETTQSGLPGAFDPSKFFLALCGRGPSFLAGLRDRLADAALVIPTVEAAEPPIPLMDGLGDVHLSVTTAAPEAQRYFDQGLALTYGFNHEAAIRSFRAAQAIDPKCAMCFWGEAYAHGPNINAPMDDAVKKEAVAAANRAAVLAAPTTPLEKALIAAVAKRYSEDKGVEQQALNRTYSAAMRDAAAQFPSNDDVAILAAESVMDLQPWDYWEADGRTPKGEIGWAIAGVERVLARSPDHPQASHLYIHLMEASAAPEKAERFADRLAAPLVPSAGHLVHMPAHLYYRVGRFADSIRVNVAAANADEAYLRSHAGSPIYRFGYYPHNVHFIVTSAQMAGDKATVVTQAGKLAGIVDADVATKLPWVQPIYAAPYLAHAQFSDPPDILAQPEPDARLPYVVGIWRYSRAVGHAARSDAAGVETELQALRQIRDGANLAVLTDNGIPAATLLSLAERVALARLATSQGRHDEAVKLYREAVALEDSIPYMEPPFWSFPVRQSLGGALLQTGQSDAARQTFMEALARYPNNGWALYGLAESQRATGDTAGEAMSRAALDRAWLGDKAWLRLERL